MTEQCGWQGPRGDDCARPAKWIILDMPESEGGLREYGVPACGVHLADIVKERAIEWVGCWVDKA